MGRFAITVEFKLKAGALADFRVLMDQNASASMQHESGCLRFDVLVPKGVPDVVFLYEIYEDEAAFKDHLKTAHFEEFNRLSTPLVETKQVVVYELVHEGLASELAV